MATGGPAPEKPFEMLDLGASSQVLRQVAADAAFDAPETQGETSAGGGQAMGRRYCQRFPSLA